MLCLCGREYCRGKAGMENMGEQGCNGLLLPPYPLCTSMTYSSFSFCFNCLPHSYASDTQPVKLVVLLLH